MLSVFRYQLPTSGQGTSAAASKTNDPGHFPHATNPQAEPGEEFFPDSSAWGLSALIQQSLRILTPQVTARAVWLLSMELTFHSISTHSLRTSWAL